MLDAHRTEERLVDGAEPERREQGALRRLHPRRRCNLRRWGRIAPFGPARPVEKGASGSVAELAVVPEVVLRAVRQHERKVLLPDEPLPILLDTVIERVRCGLCRECQIDARGCSMPERLGSEVERDLCFAEAHRRLHDRDLRPFLSAERHRARGSLEPFAWLPPLTRRAEQTREAVRDGVARQQSGLA